MPAEPWLSVIGRYADIMYRTILFFPLYFVQIQRPNPDGSSPFSAIWWAKVALDICPVPP